MHPQYSIHGTSDVTIDGPLLISDVTGPFNLQLVIDWSQKLFPIAQQFKLGGAAAAITVFHRSCLTPPDALQFLRKSLQYAATRQNFKAFALVIDRSVEGAAIADVLYREPYGAFAHYALFTELEPAKQWARAHVEAANAASNGATGA